MKKVSLKPIHSFIGHTHSMIIKHRHRALTSATDFSLCGTIDTAGGTETKRGCKQKRPPGCAAVVGSESLASPIDCNQSGGARGVHKYRRAGQAKDEGEAVGGEAAARRDGVGSRQ